MGSYKVDTNSSTQGNPYTVIYTQDVPMNYGVSAIHYQLLYAVDRFEAVEVCLSGLGGYGTIIAVLSGHHIPLLKGPGVLVWNGTEKYKTVEIDVVVFDNSRTNPAKLVPKKPKKRKKSETK